MKLAREDIGLSSLLSSLVEHLRLIKLYLADLQALEEAAGAVTSNSVVAALSSGILVQQLKALAAPRVQLPDIFTWGFHGKSAVVAERALWLIKRYRHECDQILY